MSKLIVIIKMLRSEFRDEEYFLNIILKNQQHDTTSYACSEQE